MLKNILIALGFWGFVNFYAGLRLIARWPWAQQHERAAWLFVLGFFLLQLIGPFGDRLVFPVFKAKFGDRFIFAAIDWLAYAAFGIMSCLVFYCLIADIITIGWMLLAPFDTLAAFDHYMLLALAAATAVTAIAGIIRAAAGPQIVAIDIPLRNLPAAFDGFKIVQISDLHISAMIGRAYAANVVAIANRLNPDLIALTGDFIDGTVAELAEDIAPLAALEAPHGKFFVTGNHEYYWNAPSWTEHWLSLGARVLSNEHQLISLNGQQIVIAGVPDYSTRSMTGEATSNPAQALSGAPQGLVKILLAHQPVSYLKAEEAGFDLQLSGHTHAGQYFPFTFLIRYFQRYYKGLNRYKNMWIYVNRGTGFWGPPLRAGAPAEITLITLRAENT